MLFHRIKLKLGRRFWRSCFGHAPTVIGWVVLLFVGFALAVAPAACQLFCTDCCADDSPCPLCVLAHTHTATPDEPLSCKVFTPDQLAAMPLIDFQFSASGDCQLLPSRAPPVFSFSLVVVD